MLNSYASKRLVTAIKTPALRNILICPYCGKNVEDNFDAEYIKMKSGHETFFHRTCLERALKGVINE